MREIKFRVWDKIRKEMLGGFVLGDMNRDWWIGKIPLQYTGLKDKNGKEIYKGDILRQQKEKGTKFQVIWNKDGFWWLNNLTDDFCAEFLWRWAKVTEVIGNIYENPELIK